MFCDIYTPDGRPFDGDPRFVLKRQLKRAADLGYTFYVSPELEYFYFKTAGRTRVLDQGGTSTRSRTRPATCAADSADARGDGDRGRVQPPRGRSRAARDHLRYTDALTMADNAMTYRMVVKEIAQAHGVYATFMPKPIEGVNGSGMHTHQSLFNGERNAFFDGDDPYHLSRSRRRTSPACCTIRARLTLVTNQWVNSYKRLRAGLRGTGLR